MRAKEEAILNDCFSFLPYSDGTSGYALSAVYYRTNEQDAVEVLACAIECATASEIVAFNPYMDIDLSQHDWSFDVDHHDFACLEEGYEILYMPLDTHLNMWSDINRSHETMKHMEGMQKYLSYCKQHGINKTVLDAFTGADVQDIMPLYHEKNQNYEIVLSMDINHLSVVLGHNPKAPEPYVVWECDRERIRGYHSGKYFKSKNDAIHSFEHRCRDNFQNSLHYKMEQNVTRKYGETYETAQAQKNRDKER